MKQNSIIAELDDGELAILQAIADGADDTFEIRQMTTLSNRAINYRLDDKETNLEDRGLVNISRTDGRVTREDNGQRRVFDAPKRVRLSDLGRKILERANSVENYRSLGKDELIEKVQSHERRIEHLETRVSVLQRELRSVTD